jgi:hypothetical protein
MKIENIDEASLTIEERAFWQSWRDAVDVWLTRIESAGWPGGENNFQTLVETVEWLGLMEALDKVSALTTAFRSMKRNDLLLPPGPVN